MPVDRLSALDRFMLRVSETWPQDIGALAILDGTPLTDLDGRFRIEVARDAIFRRLHLVPRFRQVISVPRYGLGPPFWADARAFDLAHHVRELHLEPPVGEAELLLATEQLRRQRLDPSRPLWEIWFLTGLPERQVGLFVKIHHTIADGMAAMATITTLLDPVSQATAEDAVPWTPAPWPSPRALFADNLVRRLRARAVSLSKLLRPRTTARRLRAGWPAIRELLAEEPATRTSLDRMVGPHRSLALIRADLAEIKAIGRARDATVNDVLLTVTAGGLRALLRSRGEGVPRCRAWSRSGAAHSPTRLVTRPPQHTLDAPAWPGATCQRPA